jgi:hypothetical protein
MSIARKRTALLKKKTVEEMVKLASIIRDVKMMLWRFFGFCWSDATMHYLYVYLCHVCSR